MTLRLACSVRPARRISTLLPLAMARSRAAANRSGSLRRGFEVGRDDLDLRAFRFIGEIVGGVEHDLVAAAGADMKVETALGAGDHQEIHHAAALEKAADVAGAQVVRQRAAPDAEPGAHRHEAHAIGAEKFQPRGFCGARQIFL